MSWDAWAAGFIDADGMIGITRQASRSGNGNYWYNVKLTASQKFLTPLQRLQGMYGGKIYTTSNRYGAWYVWSLNSKDTLPALRVMLPWLVVKKARAELAIQFLTEEVNKAAMWQQMRDLQKGETHA
jgi:hypothetical protein